MEFRGTAPSLLPALLDSVPGESLGVSVLFDSAHCHKSVSLGHPDPPTVSVIKPTVVAFKETLRMPAEKLRKIEESTREQRDSPLWFAVRRYHITASRFGEIQCRRADTPPD